MNPVVPTQQEVPAETESVFQVKANKAFSVFKQKKREVKVVQDTLNEQLEKDEDYAAFKEEQRQVAENLKSHKEKLIAENKSCQKFATQLQELKVELKDEKQVIDDFSRQAIRDGEQLTLFDSIEGKGYKIEDNFNYKKKTKGDIAIEIADKKVTIPND